MNDFESWPGFHDIQSNTGSSASTEYSSLPTTVTVDFMAVLTWKADQRFNYGSYISPTAERPLKYDDFGKTYSFPWKNDISYGW